jgi:hypothetical protein
VFRGTDELPTAPVGADNANGITGQASRDDDLEALLAPNRPSGVEKRCCQTQMPDSGVPEVRLCSQLGAIPKGG